MIDTTPGTPPTRRPSPQRANDVKLEADAVNLILELVQRQLDRAMVEAPPPNVSIAGDGEVKQKFWQFLSLQTQRSVFLRLCKQRRFWPRVRSCIGAPPFVFLRHEDNEVLNAAGIALNRKNMTSTHGIHDTTEIGFGHFYDNHGRVYKVVTDDNTKSLEIPSLRVLGASRIVLDIKLPRKTAEERHEIMKRRLDRDSILFPKFGEKLTLNPRGGGDVLVLNVRSVQQRGAKSPVARLFCVR